MALGENVGGNARERTSGSDCLRGAAGRPDQLRRVTLRNSSLSERPAKKSERHPKWWDIVRTFCFSEVESLLCLFVDQQSCIEIETGTIKKGQSCDCPNYFSIAYLTIGCNHYGAKNPIFYTSYHNFATYSWKLPYCIWPNSVLFYKHKEVIPMY